MTVAIRSEMDLHFNFKSHFIHPVQTITGFNLILNPFQPFPFYCGNSESEYKNYDLWK